MWAERLRRRTIALLDLHDLSRQARRLELPGSEGYPDEEDFRWLSMASCIGFEVNQSGMAAPLPYGDRPIAATVYYHRVADGAGHLSDHFDLHQVYYSRDLVVRRLRLSGKTNPALLVSGGEKPVAIAGDVKIGELWKHRAAIVAAIATYPLKRAQALVTVLSREYGLCVKW